MKYLLPLLFMIGFLHAQEPVEVLYEDYPCLEQLVEDHPNFDGVFYALDARNDNSVTFDYIFFFDDNQVFQNNDLGYASTSCNVWCGNGFCDFLAQQWPATRYLLPHEQEPTLWDVHFIGVSEEVKDSLVIWALRLGIDLDTEFMITPH